MALVFKKEFKEFHLPKTKLEIKNVPKANYFALQGEGNPNEEVERINRRYKFSIAKPIPSR